jgi:hypothetical protein
VRAACWIFLIFDAATICIALVICAVLLMDLIRRRMSRGLCITKTPDHNSEAGPQTLDTGPQRKSLMSEV